MNLLDGVNEDVAKLVAALAERVIDRLAIVATTVGKPGGPEGQEVAIAAGLLAVFSIAMAEHDPEDAAAIEKILGELKTGLDEIVSAALRGWLTVLH